MSPRGLTEKQQLFVKEYLVDLNATQAAIRAGYSERTAYSQGQRLLKKVEVATAIAEAKQVRSEEVELTADNVVRQVARLGFSDIRKLFDDQGNLRRINTLDDDTAAAVQSVKVVTRSAGVSEDGTIDVEYVHEIRLANKDSALDKLMKHLGQYEADNRQRSPISDLSRDLQKAIAERIRVLNSRG